MAMNIIAVFVGGGLGSTLRYLVGVLLQRSTIALPLSTLLSNVIACVIFAVTVKLFNERSDFSPNLKLFLLTGICGGLSTFSTFSYETFQLFKQGQTAWAIANILVSLLLCIAIFLVLQPKHNN